jgi:hydrogenase-1 operon protein HyaF
MLESGMTQPMPGGLSCCGTQGVAAAVLREVAGLLNALAVDPALNETIDLSGLPLNADDLMALRRRLGEGEVEARLDLGGPSLLSETAYAGVWWLSHADSEGRSLLTQIVVARVPALLLAHPPDIEAAAGRLAAELDTCPLEGEPHA